jgi:uncharacterized protein (TIGR03067 family)
MKRIARGIFFFAAMCGIGATGVNGFSPGQTRDASLNGVWTAESLHRGGKAAPPAMTADIKMTFRDGSLLITGYFGPEEEKASFTTDRSVTPNQIDLVGPKGEKVPGIYELRDGRLTMALPPANSTDRPKSLASPEGSTVLLFVMRKSK